MNDYMRKFCSKISLLIIIFLLTLGPVLSQDIREEFKQENGDEWEASIGPWGYIMYAYRNIPEVTGETLTDEQANETAGNFLNKNAAFFGVESYTFINSLYIVTATEEFWVFNYNGKTFEGEIPPQIVIQSIMTKDGQVYSIGDMDMVTDESTEYEPPVTEDDAVESAQEGAQTGIEPSDVGLQEYSINEGESRLVWNVTFEEPDNKEVIVDATTGEILSIRPTDSGFDFKKILEFLKNPYLIIAIILIVIALIGIIFYKRRKHSPFEGLEINSG